MNWDHDKIMTYKGNMRFITDEADLQKLESLFELPILDGVPLNIQSNSGTEIVKDEAGNIIFAPGKAMQIFKRYNIDPQSELAAFITGALYAVIDSGHESAEALAAFNLTMHRAFDSAKDVIESGITPEKLTSGVNNMVALTRLASYCRMLAADINMNNLTIHIRDNLYQLANQYNKDKGDNLAEKINYRGDSVSLDYVIPRLTGNIIRRARDAHNYTPAGKSQDGIVYFGEYDGLKYGSFSVAFEAKDLLPIQQKLLTRSLALYDEILQKIPEHRRSSVTPIDDCIRDIASNLDKLNQAEQTPPTNHPAANDDEAPSTADKADSTLHKWAQKLLEIGREFGKQGK